ncbi:MAG: hypothetical protein GY719_43410 [bacterium]|nr:hypothetical protein [bacterium]
MPRRKSPSATVRHDGGLCAVFVNSGNARRKSISTYGELLAWGQRHGVLGDADAERLARAAEARPADAEAVERQTRETRALLERILQALVERRTPAADDMKAFNQALGAATANRRMVPAESGWRWGWGDRGGDDLDRVLWHVLMSAAEVLTTRYHRKVLVCAAEGCGLFLVDRLPGRPRKWCRRCGIRARSKKRYHSSVKPARNRRRAAQRRRVAEDYQRRVEAKRAEEEEEDVQDEASSKGKNRNVF